MSFDHSRLRDNPVRTRADLQQLALDLYRPVEELLKRDGPETLLGPYRGNGGPVVEALEGFSRQLWALGPLQAGSSAPLVEWSLLRELLVHGVSSGGWGEIEDSDQRMVEQTAIALSLVWARPFFWEPLSAQSKTRVAEWIGRINAKQVIPNNWLWFRILANAALRELGQPHDPRVEKSDLALIDGMWRGASGYSDGPEEHRDYYVPMAMHYYGLVYATMVRGAQPDRARKLEERADAFGPAFLSWFANDGAAPAFGRSLHYRFAQGALWAAFAFNGRETIPWPVLRGTFARHLRWWLKRPICSDNGVLSLGFGREQPGLAEGYASSSSPYWAMKVFLPLALPESHPFWQAEEDEVTARPPVQRDISVGFVTRPQQGADVVLLAASRSRREWLRHNEAKYHKFAYSAQMAFSVAQGSTSLVLLAPDSMLALCRDGVHWRVRENSEEFQVEDDRLRSVWRPWDDVTVETLLVPDTDGNGHRREHRIASSVSLRSFEGGFCVPRDPSQPSHKDSGRGYASIVAGGFRSEIKDADSSREGRIVEAEPNSHLLWPLTFLPGLEAEVLAGESVLACHVVGAAIS